MPISQAGYSRWKRLIPGHEPQAGCISPEELSEDSARALESIRFKSRSQEELDLHLADRVIVIDPSVPKDPCIRPGELRQEVASLARRSQ